MKTYVAGKIHGVRVTDKSVKYHGSVSICPELMRAAGIEVYEQVHVINLSNGNRWITYAIPAEPGAFTLNGGGARLGEVGDECVILTYEQHQCYAPNNNCARVVFVNEHNAICERTHYPRRTP